MSRFRARDPLTIAGMLLIAAGGLLIYRQSRSLAAVGPSAKARRPILVSIVDEASMESFPASDAPGWTSTSL